MAEKTEKLGRIITGVVRFSYAHVFEPKTIGDSDKPKFSVSLLIPKTDKTTLSLIQKAIADIKSSTAALAKWGGKLPPDAKLKLPLRDGDAEYPDDEAYKGMYFLNANCDANRPPQIIDQVSKRLLTSEGDFYSGCYGRACVTLYAFENSGSKGIAVGLNNLLKTSDGESLSGASSAEDDFAEFLRDEDVL